jgi:hypothetical protein
LRQQRIQIQIRVQLEAIELLFKLIKIELEESIDNAESVSDELMYELQRVFTDRDEQ